MNTENLHTLITRYAQRYDEFNNSENDELFKWEAVRCFRDAWFAPDAVRRPFSELFSTATKESSVLINNSTISPTTGIVKMAELEPATVERLFRETLFADYNSLDELQEHMDGFLDEIEKLRFRLFPRLYRYKQERHAASCYLAFFAPETHYIYRYSEAEEFARYIEFGKDLGSGPDFSLKNYYEMADLLVSAIREHTDLVDLYLDRIKGNNKYYPDESLHLLAFDLMYCCRAYNLYRGLQHKGKQDVLQAHAVQKLKEHLYAQQERLLTRLREVEAKIAEYREISLLNVTVTQPKYGTGLIVAQEDEKVTVQFDHGPVTYFIGRQYPGRPTFEDDDALVDALTELAALKVEQRQIKGKLTGID